MKKAKKMRMIKSIILVVVICLILVFVGFKIKKVYVSIHSQNIKDYEWLSRNVSIKIDDNLGKGIYSISKSKDIDIYHANYQKVISEKLKNLLSDNGSFSNMKLIYNPYGTNTLSFNVYFETDIETSLSYTIHVDSDKIGDFSRTLYNSGNNNLTKNHSYQLIGFVPGYVNNLKLILNDHNGNVVEEKNIQIDLTKVKVNSEKILKSSQGKSKKELSEGLYTILGNDSDLDDYVSFYDDNGVLRGEIPIIGYRAHAILFKDDKMYFSISQTKIAEVNNLGEVVQVYRTGHYYLHHDYTFDNDGNILVLANNQEKDTEEDCIIKINLKTKEVTEVIDMEDLFESYVKTCTLDTTSVRDEGEDGLDWLHLNSIEYVDGAVILSSRETSSIIKIKDLEKDARIDYILADKKIWEDTEFADYVYEKIGNFKIHAGQHSVRYSSTKEEKVYYLTFYNNNYGKANSQPDFNYSTIGVSNDNAFNGDNSYYYVYKVDEKNKTFELVDSFDVEYSGIVSSVQSMDNGNIIVDSGTKGVFAEYDADKKLIKKFTVKLNKYMVYRVLKYDFNKFWFK